VIRLGSWTGEHVPWLRFWALLVAAAAGTLVATLDLTAQIAGDNGRVTVPIVKDVFNFLVEKDKSIDKAKATQGRDYFEGISRCFS
jgi:hypothetical protein